MINILFITHSFNKKGGIERVIKLKTDVLSNKYKCNLLLLYNLGVIAYNLKSNIKIFYLNKKIKRVRESFLCNILKMRSIIKENSIDIMIIEGRGVNFIPLLLKLFFDIKIIFCDHGSLDGYSSTKLTFKQNFCNFLDYFFIKNLADKIVTLTESEKYNYINKIGVKNEKITNIYNIIDDDLFKNISDYDCNSKKIITVSRLDFAKGLEYLIEVAKLVFAKHPDWQWDIYGDGDKKYKNKIINLIEQNDLQNHVILQGNRSDIYDLYQNYSIYVMTSRYEGLPMVLLEAKAKKLPIVSFDINSGPSDIIRDGIDGFLINPFDCQKMADKICELIENPELRQKFSDNAHGNIDKFSKEKIIKQWCDLIDSLS